MYRIRLVVLLAWDLAVVRLLPAVEHLLLVAEHLRLIQAVERRVLDPVAVQRIRVVGFLPPIQVVERPNLAVTLQVVMRPVLRAAAKSKVVACLVALVNRKVAQVESAPELENVAASVAMTASTGHVWTCAASKASGYVPIL